MLRDTYRCARPSVLRRALHESGKWSSPSRRVVQTNVTPNKVIGALLRLRLTRGPCRSARATAGGGSLRFHFRRAKRPNNCSSGYLLALIGAGLTSVATSLAFGNFGEIVAFFLAIVANHLDGFSKMAGMLGIDRCKRV
jgi:hypothetical protein